MSAHAYLADLLDETVDFVRAHVVFADAHADTVALWNAHTYVYDCSAATPYLHPYSPEPGSGKTTLLDVLETTASNPIQADNVSEAVLFRMISKERPTLLLDEIDAYFGTKPTEKSTGVQQVLNSGYRKGKKAYRCVGPRQDYVSFDVYCPKATAGLDQLPGTLASRSIPIAMKPPRPEDEFTDFDYEEAIDAVAILRGNLRSWAEEADGVLRDPRLKPEKLGDLDARANQIWRILFRIADHAGGEWPERARAAALELSSSASRHVETSTAVQLLGHIRDLFADERMTCGELAGQLNGDELPYGGWNDGKGITSRQLGKKLSPYGIIAKPIRIFGERVGNGYERDQFEDAWARYLPADELHEREPGEASTKDVQSSLFLPPVPVVPVDENGANPHEYSDVPLKTPSGGGKGTGTGEWMAADGNWRSYETDPPTFASEVKDKR